MGKFRHDVEAKLTIKFSKCQESLRGELGDHLVVICSSPSIVSGWIAFTKISGDFLIAWVTEFKFMWTDFKNQFELISGELKFGVPSVKKNFCSRLSIAIQNFLICTGTCHEGASLIVFK